MSDEQRRRINDQTPRDRIMISIRSYWPIAVFLIAIISSMAINGYIVNKNDQILKEVSMSVGDHEKRLIKLEHIADGISEMRSDIRKLTTHILRQDGR